MDSALSRTTKIGSIPAGCRLGLLSGVLALCWATAGLRLMADTSSYRDNTSPTVCRDCHHAEGEQFTASVHATAGFDCRDCHGGDDFYEVAPELRERCASRLAAATQSAAPEPASPTFDHGPEFLGKPTREQIPERCARCHADVEMMNPYGLPTDQFSQYRRSGHGKALFEKRNDRAAVCVDCHATHAILGRKDTGSSVHPKNVPATCGRCHSDPRHMAGTNLNVHILDQYKESVHGRGLLEGGDLSMPQCATCHGSHSAVPPGLRDVGHVCGRCHQQEEQKFLESPHAKFPLFPRCVACHTRDVGERDHLITPVKASPQEIEKTYKAVLRTMPRAKADPTVLERVFTERREPPIPSYETFCQRCHNPARESGHREFFGELDEKAARLGKDVYEVVRSSEIRYAATATAVEELQHGVLLVNDEALMLDEARTKLVSLAILQHTLDVDKIKAEAGELEEITGQINDSLKTKVRGLEWRYWTLIPMWAFIVVFVAVLWKKYKQLKHAMVKPLGSP